ncbi:HEPN domain-containing protein [Desulfotignum phosphitoxidans]|uniref:Uncharacterized protein n=1 Tax=Desulfotignum phosphitoxidans DSM 13687 TaxID=1286635 RepID=S0G7Q3_9BACT|nr:HEPN domain-containing protein [Desulfotignum phosphitoxidans]EMS81362.1 hypothetical protein Dpo_1c05030 [Desulfotignum phosphitoxidans DSM 13687]
MTTEFEIIQNNLKKGSYADCFNQRDTRCLSGLQPNVWMIQGHDGIIAYFKLVHRIYSTKDIKANYTIKHVENNLDSVILNNIGKENVTEKTIVNEVKKQLPTATSKTFDIMRNIFGIKLSKNYREIDPFKFQKGKNAYRQFLHKSSLNLTFIKNENVAEYTVRFQIKSVTRERALEIADETFTTLEYLFAFILGRKDCGHEVRILRQTKENRLFHMVKSEDGQISTGGSRHNLVHNQIDLNDKFFKNSKVKKLFSLVPTQNLKPIENRLNKAISWIGKGLLCDSSIESIICYCSALESILIRNSKAIISPSIVASLSEYCAFFLGKSQGQRKDLIVEVKKIYSERSAGTHGGKLVADPMIEGSALSISRAIVFRILELYPNKIKSEKDVIAYVDRLKYS